MKAYYVKPTAPLHLQTGGLDHESIETFPKADTLSSALLYLWFRQYGNVPGFPEQIPFRLSSWMPAIKKEGSLIRCYPKPVGMKLQTEELDYKVFKKIEFLTEPVFKKWRNGQLKASDFPAMHSNYLWFEGKVWAHEAWDTEKEVFYRQSTRTRIVSDRVTSQTTPFHFSSTQFGKHIYLYFLAEVEAEHEARFKATLRMLGDEGIGADRTIGMGLFELEGQAEPIKLDTTAAVGWVNVGIYNPADDEVEAVKNRKSRYSLFNRYGWTSGHALRRQTVAVLGEGSYIAGSRLPKGTIRKVLDPDDPKLIEKGIQLNHPIYRDCRGFFLPCN